MYPSCSSLSPQLVRRRDEKAFTGRCDRDRCREVTVIPLIYHHRDQYGFEESCVRGSRTGNSAEEIGSDDVDHGHTAAHPANAGVEQCDQLFRYTAAAHENAHGNKERDRHQREGADALSHLLAECVQRLALIDEAGHGHQRDRIGDRETKNNQNKEANDKNGNCNGTRIQFPLFVVKRASGIA